MVWGNGQLIIINYKVYLPSLRSASVPTLPIIDRFFARDGSNDLESDFLSIHLTKDFIWLNLLHLVKLLTKLISAKRYLLSFLDA